MRSSNTAVRLEPELKHRAEALAASEHRSFSAIVRDALETYIAKREAEQAEIRDAVAAWKEHQTTGLHITGDETMAWLRTWGTEQEGEPPACHL